MTDKAVHFSRATIVGIGLIGSSLARAIREQGLADEIVGYDADEDALSRALALGVLDKTAESLPAALKGADLVVLATPVGAIGKLVEALSQSVEDDALVIDVGSVKGAVYAAAAAAPERFHFVPCHPVAGTEQSGPEAGFASLFRDRWCILTPLPRETEGYKTATQKAAALWAAVGSNVEFMDVAHHDLALAVTSHLPHLIAFTLVGAADDLENVAEGEIVKYSAGGFRDFTRIAASDPVMWRDVFLNNKDAVLEVLGRFSEELAVMQRAIRWGDGKTLEDAFSRVRGLRRAIVAAGQESAAPNFGRDQNGQTEKKS